MPRGVHPRKSAIDRFWSYVDKNGPVHPVCGQCWLWIASKNENGYGYFQVNYEWLFVHRWIFEQTYGIIANEDALVMHQCDNPACVNPDHLDLGTHADNSADMVAKGRSSHGEKNYNAKLTDEDVIFIRANHVKGNSRWHPGNWEELCARFCIHRNTLDSITSGKSWKHLLKEGTL